jgi:hypothetical protein
VQGKSNPDRQMLDAAAFCRGLVEEGTLYAFLADHRKELFKDEDFLDLFPSGRGRPSTPVELICSVMVLQALEGLSDRDAIRQLRNRLDWKVACGLALDNEGFAIAASNATTLGYRSASLRSISDDCWRSDSASGTAGELLRRNRSSELTRRTTPLVPSADQPGFHPLHAGSSVRPCPEDPAKPYVSGCSVPKGFVQRTPRSPAASGRSLPTVRCPSDGAEGQSARASAVAGLSSLHPASALAASSDEVARSLHTMGTVC